MLNKKITLGLLSLVLSGTAVGHGLMSEPASRNWLCGAVTKPDQAVPGSACAQAMATDPNGGYQFMSVLTHDIGRKGARSNNVCGFDSETWQGGATPWDNPVDWPTQPVSAGPLEITWDISWGPHFDDTEEFVYWITKPDFQYQVGRALTWDDFEEEPFCDLSYSDTNPNGNPNVTADKAGALFHTRCTIPERSGRHVIYGEWGRNQWTYERFHGCIDVSYGGGGNPNPVVADISATPSNSTFAGAGTISLSAAGSSGNNLSYQWSIDAANPSLYSFSSTTAATTTLSLAAPLAQSNVTVRLQVTSGTTTSNDSFTFTHVPVAGASWEDLGALTATSRTLAAGDRVSVRLVRTDGTDVYLPATPLVITSATTAANAWTYALAQAVNDAADDVQVGVLNSSGDVVPQQNATSNRVYAETPSVYANAFLQVESTNNSSSSVSSATTSSSSSAATGSQCNWYGTLHPLCTTTQSGWGWEQNRSCIAASTCSSQPAPYGIVGGSASSTPASSAASSAVNVSSAPSSAASSSTAGNTGGNCEYVVTNEWSDGFTGAIRITNTGNSAISSWSVSWDYTDGSRVTNSWNASVTGNNPYTASGSGWNGAIAAGQTIEFGFQGTKGGSGNAAIPTVTGSVCN